MAKAKKTSGRPRSEAQKATEKNLIPNNERSPAEVRENGRKGGIASGKARRRKKTVKQEIDVLLSLPVKSDKNREALEALGINPDDANNQTMIVVSAYRNALKGDMRAAQLVMNRFGMSEAEKQQIKLKKEELKLAREKAKREADAEKNMQAYEAEYRGIPSMSIIPKYASVLRDIKGHEHSEYVLDGGRGSTKSSFVSLAVVDLIETNPNFNAVALRKVGNTIRDSVYNQIVWAINDLGLSDRYKCSKSPADIERIGTGQHIFFRGTDDPLKVKSIKPVHGYIAVVWFEELDQFAGDAEIRSVEQSTLRGGDISYVFKTFNPPKSRSNWANKYILMQKPGMVVVHNTYKDVPSEWLGKKFIDDADFLKEVNPDAYKHEYLGVANGDGGNVFENVEVREITDDEIKQFDRIYHGVDWGWYPDPFDYVRCYYDAARLTLYVFMEYRCNKRSNRETADKLIEMGVGSDIVTCDSAEEKSVQDYRAYGIAARGAEKGPGSVDYSMKWLASLKKIVIDPVRCPDAAKEFTDYEYERDKDGNVMTGYPDKDNHSIDAVRYAMNSVWKHRGK